MNKIMYTILPARLNTEEEIGENICHCRLHHRTQEGKTVE